MKKYLISLLPGILLFWLFYTTHVGEVNLFLRALGRVSFFYIALALFITPFVTLTGKQRLLTYRRSLGVIACYLAIFHALYYFKMEYDFQKTFFILEHFKAVDIITGLIGLTLIIMLGVTSNDFSVNKLKAYWGKIQSLTYPLFVIVALHVAFASRFENFYIITISALVLVRTLAYFKDAKNAKSGGKPRYLCVPCGYIYDEDVGDPDGGIAPGTKWEDIPDDWRCPVCGVGKSDFILIGENTPEETKVEGTIIAMETLTPDVIELQVTSDTQFFVRPGQFATFDWKDEAGVFKRTYSIASYIDGVLTFLIKVSKDGRGGKAIRTMKVGDTVCISHIGGTFKLIKNDNKKVFLATGTGLAPIYSMISQLDREGIKSHLYFGIRNLEDVFYEEKLKRIKNLTLRIHCSGLETDVNCDLVRGRINIDEFEFPPATDFYICGSPDMLDASIAKLRAKGYANIYFEKF